MWVLGTKLWSLSRIAVFLITALAASSQLLCIYILGIYGEQNTFIELGLFSYSL